MVKSQVKSGLFECWSFHHVRSWSLVERELERNSKWEQQRGPVGTEQRHSVSPIPISPSAASLRVYTPSPPHPLFHSPASAPIVSQSASSGACDVTVQSDFVWANQGMLLSPKKRESAGLIQTRPERDRQMLWWEGKHEITDGERYMDRERETVRQSSRNVRRVNEFVRVKNRTKVLAYRPWER